MHMSSHLSDLRFAIRSLKKTPGFTAVAVATLALCIGANSAVFSLINAVLLRPLGYTQPERLVLVWESAPFFGLQDSPVAPANFFDWESRSHSFTAMGALEEGSFRLTGDGEPEVVQGSVVTASLWRALKTQPALGRVFGEEDDRPGAAKVVVISDGFWRRRFAGEPDVLGRTLRLMDEPHTIIGVLAQGSEPPSAYSSKLGEVWIPLKNAYNPKDLTARGRHNWMVIARLRDGVSIATADAEMKGIGLGLAREYPDTNEKVGAFVAPLRDHFVRDGRKPIFLLLGTVAALLLIGCSNLANLLLTRSAHRAKEVALRTALGAGVWQLLRRFLWESILLCSLGSIAGLILAPLTFEFLAHLAPGDMAGLNSLETDWRVVAFTMVIAILTTVVFSVLPVFQLRRLDIGHSLKQSARTIASAAGSRNLRAAIVCVEVALAFVLLIGAGLLLRTFANLRNVEPGFQTGNLLAVRMPMSMKERDPLQIVARQSELLRAVRAIPGVEHAGFTNRIPLLEKGNVSGIGAEGHEAGRRFQCNARIAGPGYFETMGIRIIQGRAIDERDVEGAPKVAMINETLARMLWPGRSPLGRRLLMGTNYEVPVVGVIADVHQSGLDVAPSPEFYISSLQAGQPSGSLVIRTKGDPLKMTGEIRKAIWSVDPDQPFKEMMTMEDVLDKEVFRRRIQTTLLAAFAGLALLLASLGLYGVLSFTVSQQTAEIGLRMALGAAPAEMMRRTMGHSMRLAVFGLVGGLAVSFAAVRVVASLLFGVQPTDLTTYASVAALLLATAALASYLPARRAMKVEPMEALREE